MDQTYDNSKLRENILNILRTEGAESLNSWLRKSPIYLDEELVSKTIASIHSELNLFEFLAKLTEPDPRFAINLVLEAAKLIHSPTLDDVYNLMLFVNQTEPALSYQAIWLLEEVSRANIELMPNLLNRLKASGIVGHMAYLAWAGAYSKNFPLESIKLISEIDADETVNNLIRIALYNNLESSVLEVAKFRAEFSHTILPSVIKFTTEHPSSYLGWQVLCILSDFCSEAAQHLNAIPQTPNTLAKGVLLRWISQKRSSVITIESLPVQEILLEIMPLALVESEIHMLFDAVVSQMLSREETAADGLAIFYALKTSDSEPSDILNLSSHAIFRSPKLFSEILADWLMAKDASSTAIRALLQQCNLGAAPCRLDDSRFQGGTPHERKRAVMRILGHTHNAPTLARFTEDFLQTTAKHPDGILAAKAILDFMLTEYPSFSTAFLEKKVSESKKDSTEFAVYNQAYLFAKAYDDARQELPTLNELAPSSQQQIAMHQRNVRSQREIGRIASEKSIISQFANQVTILQGTRVATLMPNGALNVTEMHSMTYSIELPMSERADPLGGMINRSEILGSAE